MIILISLLLALFIVLVWGRALHKHPAPFYIGATAIAALGLLASWHGDELPDAVRNWVLPVLIRGGLAGALFIVVMVTGAFPNGSAPIKRLMPIRGELSILACILTIGHNIAYGRTYFVSLFTNPASLPLYQLLAAICSLLMILIMLPLFITSFRFIRRKLSAKTWKSIQRFAYLFYFLMFIHVMLLNVPGAVAGHTENIINVFVYSAVFTGYLICRIMKWAGKHKSSAAALIKRQLAGSACAVAGALFLTLALSATSIRSPADAVSEVDEDAESIASAELSTDASQTGSYNDGTYTGSAMGMNGEITVSVEIKDDTISGISVESHQDDEEYFSDAMVVIDDILDANSTDVDTISGATWSSGGIIDAVNDALKKADGSS